MITFLGVTADLKHLRNESGPWTALDLDDDVERVRDIGFDSSVWHWDAALQDTRCESRNALGSRIRVDGRDSSAVPRL